MPRRRTPDPPCPDEALHTPGQPDGYVAWHEWAEEKGKTHTQKRCPGCRLFKIWVPLPTLPSLPCLVCGDPQVIWLAQVFDGDPVERLVPLCREHEDMDLRERDLEPDQIEALPHAVAEREEARA